MSERAMRKTRTGVVSSDKMDKTIVVTISQQVKHPLYGKIVVATGKLKHYTRDGIQNKLLEIGAIPASSVTKKTNYLIVGEKAGSKLTKAQQLGVPTLTEEEFEALLAG